VATEWLKLGRADECQICVDVVCARYEAPDTLAGTSPPPHQACVTASSSYCGCICRQCWAPCPTTGRCCRINLAGADLAGANLPGTFLGTANLSLTSLRNANLRGANLDDATLERADLFRGGHRRR